MSSLDNIDIALGSFIQKWLPEYAAHLADTDDNDGERLRKTIKRIAMEWHQQEIQADAKRREGIGKYLAASKLLRHTGYLLEHRRQGGLPEMTAQVIGELYDEVKGILDENDKYMRRPVEQPQQYMDEPCPRCHGTGKNPPDSVLGWPDAPCYYCSGTGKRPVIEAQTS